VSAAPAARFRLYIMGGHIGSARAEPDLRRALEAYLPGAYQLEVVDLRSRSDLAAADDVMIVPTVLRLDAASRRRAAGDFSDPAGVAAALGLEEEGT
jgi:circadian clock protein KaiB